MDGIVLQSGNRWNKASVLYGVQRLAHLDQSERLAWERNLAIVAFNSSPKLEVGDEDLQVWSWGIDRSEMEEVWRLACERRLLREAPSRWRNGFHLVLDRAQRRLQILRGEFCPVEFLFACKRRSLFAAPDRKAFSNLNSLGDIHRLAPGYSLNFDLERGKATIVDARLDWPAPRAPDTNYDAVVKRFRNLARESVHRSIANSPRPLALALSGGIDSAVVALLASTELPRLDAYHVWFGEEGSEPPLDLQNARRLGSRMNLNLHEIRIDTEELDGLIEEMILRSESSLAWAIEGTLHLLALGRRLEREGIASCLTGNGPDALMGSFVEMGLAPEGTPFQRVHAEAIRILLNPEHENRLIRSFGFEILSPLKNDVMISFCLGLQESCMRRTERDVVYSKILLRDAFSDSIPEDIAYAPKVSPRWNNNAAHLLESRYGSPEQRQENYRKRYRRLLMPTRLNRWQSIKQRLGALRYG